jgi:hypothetical protein
MRTLINNLKFSQKFLLIGLLAAIMLTLPTLVLVRDNLARMATAQREVLGLSPCRHSEVDPACSSWLLLTLRRGGQANRRLQRGAGRHVGGKLDDANCAGPVPCKPTGAHWPTPCVARRSPGPRALHATPP